MTKKAKLINQKWRNPSINTEVKLSIFIPHLTDKLVIEKNVPGNDPSLLKVSFFYSIENVGSSWYVDAFPIGETFKTVNFNFQ